MSKKIFLASPRWYCAWVDRAIGMLNDVIDAYQGETIYVNHEIVHNKFIVQYFERKWVVFTDDIKSVPSWSIMLFSAHWVAPSFVREAKEHGLRCLDASCPLVIKVHNEAKKFIRDGYKIIYIGKKDHQEAIWVKDNDPDNIFVVYSQAEVDELDLEAHQKLAVLNQTTLSVDDTKETIEYVQKCFPQVELPAFSDICYATTNRQEAVKELVTIVDALIIVGSQNSSNSLKLKLIWDKVGIKSILIDNKNELPDDFLDWVENIGISSWASAPDNLVQELITHLESHFDAKLEREIVTKKEKMIFPYKIELS